MTEWLETNGAGAFCCSTVTERNDRKYHGLLVTPVKGREGRYHILSSVECSALDGSGLVTGVNNYPDAVYPRGDENIIEQDILPLPAWIYSKNGTSLKKEIFMIESEKAVWLAFTLLEGTETLDLSLKFLFTFRNCHELTRENNNIKKEFAKTENTMSIHPYESLPECLISFSGQWQQEGELFWDKDVCYETERERGHEWIEDRFVPGHIKIRIKRSKPFIIRVSVEDDERERTADKKVFINAYKKEKQNREKYLLPGHAPLDILKYQSKHFILKNPSGNKSINAGYPWFGEWGRDTMLSLPGITIYRGDAELGAQILTDYASMIKDGLLPNTLGETQGFTSYNSIDAGLLYCWAVNKFLDAGYGANPAENKILKESIYPAVHDIVLAFIENRVPNAELNETGLVSSGSPDTQLTWMDATAWGRPVTPRYGFAVELNALWYDALFLYRNLNSKFGYKVDVKADGLLTKIPGEFRKMFWNDDHGGISDTVNIHGQDNKIRPNMLFASSSREGLISDKDRRHIVRTAKDHLLTPFGLRTLSPVDPDFQPYYSGGPNERDSKYHQGTVWPWLLGILIESDVISTKDIDKTAKFWSDYIENLLNKHLFNQGWGFISEVFDAIEPDEGKGTFAQAWSCSEIIRASEIINRIGKDEED